jgi:hypothetical protein
MVSRKRESQVRVQKMAEAASARSSDDTRHRCFISYHVDDEAEVTKFLDDFGDQIIGTAVGVTADDDFVDSDDTDYIMNQIRERYLGSTTVTIVLIGKCTWSRRFVDWEVYSSLREYKSYGFSGLVAITLPSVATDPERQLPPRVDDNVADESGYARWKKYPASKASLKNYVDEAFEGRSSRTYLIENSRDRKKYNSSC